MQKRHSFATGCQCLDLVVTRAYEAGLVAQGKCLLDPAREHVLDTLGEIRRNADLPFEAAGKHVRLRRLGYRVFFGRYPNPSTWEPAPSIGHNLRRRIGDKPDEIVRQPG
jgi:hypothetical protein